MNKEDIFNIIAGHVCEVIPELKNHRFQSDDSLKTLGANSVDRAEIVMMPLASLSLNLPLTETAGAENIDELARIFHEKLQSK